MGPLHFTTAKGSRAGCGHLLGGALRQEWVARLSRGDGWQSRVHGVTGERDGENQVGGSEGTCVPVHPSPGFYSYPETFPDFTKLRSRTTTPSMHHNCFACTLGVVVPLRSLVLFLLFPRALLMGWRRQSRGLSHESPRGQCSEGVKG